MENKIFYITDAIDYANGKPHLGHALEKIGTDVMARYMRMKGYDVYFTVGTDEHAAKIEKLAFEQGKTPKELCDINSDIFKQAWKELNISYNDFIRTTDERHKKVVREIFKKVYDNGFIYKAKYEGFYCIGCETYIKEKDLVDGKCPNHNTEPEKRIEENYFFALSKFQDKLLEIYKTQPERFTPESRRNEIINIIEGGLEDVSVSRANSQWGIKLPIDEEHIVWVWFDALINYISVIGYPDDEKFKKYWPNVHHVIGKDITRLHCIIWPALLMAADIEIPYRILSHGFIYTKGEKMSKSLGNVINPLDIIKKYGPDPLRYYAMSEVGMIRDGDFTWDLFIKRFNSDLANDLGNLLHRTKNMVKKYLDNNLDISNCDKNIADTCNYKNNVLSNVADYTKLMDEFDIPQAIEKAMNIIKDANKYIDHSAPWNCFKQGDKQTVSVIMYNILESFRIASVLLFPIIPQTVEKIFDEIGIEFKKEELLLNNLSKWGLFPEISQIKVGEPLFPRIEIEVDAEDNKKQEGKKEEGISLIEFADWEKLDLRVAEILSAQKHKDADRLLVVKLKVGEYNRQVVAGIADYYNPEELKGKKVIMIYNLKPAKLRGILSEGMLLACKKKNKLSLITLDKDMDSGIKLS
ncbi:MAG: methionine--tRNA ligase [Candidatus Muirbacterium halophilum]|nr:methionine--tRNA ligase [Candidatus Muirbacterium halophilum]MCK9474349.1 methionine--tRNA ligase [Candidatus Muirbacterium halophilum]